MCRHHGGGRKKEIERKDREKEGREEDRKRMREIESNGKGIV